MRPRLHRSSYTGDDCTRESSISSTELVARHSRDKHIARPGAKVVDGRDQSFLCSCWLTESFDEAGVDVDGCDDSNVIPVIFVSSYRSR